MFPCEMEMFRNQFDIVCVCAVHNTEWKSDGTWYAIVSSCAKRDRFEGVKEPIR